ncbi:carbonic anhydrase [Chitinophaga skermanii]|uniref:Carbonic anhydrase n=1 Tax=Chitinophaga skermanii TaxID=331697 RepID=A0A327Q4D5_9BACT|nr:carbonic anhydrase family protein [Chitinophaga skermanii]RAI98637.1 carbonic anhydrase [Chitinophaga skermanii]
MQAYNKTTQGNLTPDQVLEVLQDGNKRFVNNLRINRNLLQQVNETRDGQWPIAAIVSCMDSRTSAELIFDLGLGDIFSIRLAGNVISEYVLGSLEYACSVAGSKFIVVLGHTKCGAIKGACDHIEMGNLTALLSEITPSVAAEKEHQDNRNSTNESFVDAVANIHVDRSVKTIMERSPILKDLIEKGTIGIIGAMYDVVTGQVSFYNHTMIINHPKSVAMVAE